FAIASSGRLAGFLGAGDSVEAAIAEDTTHVRLAGVSESGGAGEARFAVSHLLASFAGVNDAVISAFVDPKDEQVMRALDYRRVDIQQGYQFRGLSWEAGEMSARVVTVENITVDLVDEMGIVASQMTIVETQIGAATGQGLFLIQSGYTPGAGF